MNAMPRILAVLLSCLVVKTVRADFVMDEVQRDPIFQQLEEYFDRGQAPSREDLLGWHAGRCYKADQANKPIATLLVGRERVIHGEHGPLFPAHVSLKVFHFIDHLGQANRWDELSTRERQEVEGLLSKNDPTHSEALLGKEGTFSKNESGNLTYHVRKFEKYLISEAIILRDVEETELKAGDRFARCYFFKNVK